MNTTISPAMGKPCLQSLVKGSSTYKLIVPSCVEEKIRYLIRKFPSTEWSGVLFYTYQGSFEDNDLVITCQDIYPMDLGSSGWTEFHMSEDVAAYMASNIELFDCETGLIHSHHSMGAFFSGQDNAMLQQEGNDTNCFVSLVVDTRGSYVARITRKVQTKSEVTTRCLGKSYEFFGQGSVSLSPDSTTTTTKVNSSLIEYFDLSVERHEIANSLDYLDARFDEIQQQKQRTQQSSSNARDISQWSSTTGRGFYDAFYPKPNAKPMQQNLFEATQPQQVSTSRDETLGEGVERVWMPNPKLIHEAVVHMLICSLIVNTDKIDLDGWIAKHMADTYKRLFGPCSVDERGKSDNSAFNEWRDFITQYTLDHFNYDDVPDSMFNSDADLAPSLVAQAIIDELGKFEHLNPYISSYINAIYLYVM